MVVVTLLDPAQNYRRVRPLKRDICDSTAVNNHNNHYETHSNVKQLMDRAEENIEQLDTGKCGADGGEEVYEEDAESIS